MPTVWLYFLTFPAPPLFSVSSSQVKAFNLTVTSLTGSTNPATSTNPTSGTTNPANGGSAGNPLPSKSPMAGTSPMPGASPASGSGGLTGNNQKSNAAEAVRGLVSVVTLSMGVLAMLL
jgi:hypothetical protein